MLDDDFFELDEDLLNATDFSKNEELNNYEDDVSDYVRSLHCMGEDHIDKHIFHANNFIENDELKLIQSNPKHFNNQILFDLELSEDVLSESKMLQVLLSKARMNIQTLIVSSRENTTFLIRKNFFLLRHQTTTFLFQLRQLLYTGRIKQSIVEMLMKPLTIYFERLSALPIMDVLHTIHSSLGNESTSPTYHLLHGHLEWRWVYLTLRLRIEQEKSKLNMMQTVSTLRETEFEEKLQLFIYDLMTISVAKFNKLHILELPTKTPFVCPCIKEIWLLVQLLVEKLNETNGQLNSFWFYFNAALKQHRERKSPYAAIKQLNVSRDTVTLYPNDCTVFSMWLLNGVAHLNGFSADGVYHGCGNVRVRDNSEMLETLLKSFVSTEPFEQNVRASLLIVNPLLTDWWPQKSELLMLFWEYFHKKLNSSFFISGAAPTSLAVTSNTAVGYLDQVNKLLDNENLNSNMASYSIFANLLGKILRRLLQIDMKNQIQKIMGRIFIKFSESKLYALNELGIHNLLTLFLVLAVTSGVKTIGQRLQNILLQLRLEKLQTSRQTCLIKGHMALLILHTEQQISIHGYVIRLLEQVNKLAAGENKLPVLRIMADASERILAKQDIFEFGEFILIETPTIFNDLDGRLIRVNYTEAWIVDYLSMCAQTEQEKFLQFINNVLVKTSTSIELQRQYPEPHLKVMQTMFKYVLPHVKQIYRQSNVFSNVPDIAATFCLRASGRNGLPNFDDLFKYFTETTCCDIQTTVKFLVSILSTSKLSKIDQIVIIRLWLKCLMLSTSANEDTRQLTKIVMKLSEFQTLCKSTEEHILEAKEPLSVFFELCGKLYESASDSLQKYIVDHLQAILAGFEKWVPISETPPAIFKIHIVIGLILFHCSRIVYVRSKPTCFFYVIMNHYILPLPLLMGKQQKLISIQAVHKIWHLVVGGIEKIGYESDDNLRKVFTDLIVKWVPQFRMLSVQKIVAKPFINCVRYSQEATVQFILEKLVVSFVSAHRRETHQNTPIVISILTEILSDVSNEANKVKIVLNATVITLLEHAMIVDDSLPSKTMIFGFFTNLFKSAAFISSLEIRNIVLSNLKTLTTKHLSYYSLYYFPFIAKLAKINATCVLEILPHLREQIGVVEELRGAGTDAKLRNALRQLEGILGR